MMRLGVDLGGTAIKSGLVDENGEVKFHETLPTHTDGGADAVLDALIDACRRQLARADVHAVGIGMPGTVDAEHGVLVRASNLPLSDFPLTQVLSKRLGLPVYLENDANCALYGEIFAGAGRDSDNFLMVTVGTGIGGGIRLGGKIHLGMENRAGEFGHMIVVMDGRPCRCGRIGCWEQYASATALCRMTREAADNFPESPLAQRIREAAGVVDGRTAFDAVRAGCSVADAVLETYAKHLSVGLNNLTAIFRPDRIVLVGGIFREGEYLLSRVRERCTDPQLIEVSALNGQAGLIGASLLPERLDPASPVYRIFQYTK